MGEGTRCGFGNGQRYCADGRRLSLGGHAGGTLSVQRGHVRGAGSAAAWRQPGDLPRDRTDGGSIRRTLDRFFGRRCGSLSRWPVPIVRGSHQQPDQGAVRGSRWHRLGGHRWRRRVPIRGRPIRTAPVRERRSADVPDGVRAGSRRPDVDGDPQLRCVSIPRPAAGRDPNARADHQGDGDDARRSDLARQFIRPGPGGGRSVQSQCRFQRQMER